MTSTNDVNCGQEHLYRELGAVVNRIQHEYDVTPTDIVGTLEIIKQEYARKRFKYDGTNEGRVT